MKKLLLLAVGLGLWLLIPCVSAQVIVGSTNIAGRVGRIILPNRIPFDTSPAPTIGIRPPRPERPDLSLDITARLLRFEKLAEVYLEQQQARSRTLAGSSEAARGRIRRH